MRARQQYTDEFKADAIAMVARGDRSIRQVADDLGLNYWTIWNWSKAPEMARKKAKRLRQGAAAVEAPSAQETPEQRIERLERENQRLQKQVSRLEEDRAILKKAAAFFAKESE
jgi:transposase-like protein